MEILCILSGGDPRKGGNRKAFHSSEFVEGTDQPRNPYIRSNQDIGVSWSICGHRGGFNHGGDAYDFDMVA
ncbi:hypothetical protein AKJ16_DCAP02080 [Drosera capensis]